MQKERRETKYSTENNECVERKRTQKNLASNLGGARVRTDSNLRNQCNYSVLDTLVL